MGTKRSNFGLVPMGGKLVAAGGYDGWGVTDVVEVPTNPIICNHIALLAIPLINLLFH